MADNADAASDAWDEVARYLEGFLNAWESGGDPPHLADFLPASRSDVRRLALVELVKLDIEQRLQDGSLRPRIEDYVAQFPELADDLGPPTDLICEEYQLRKSAGETVRAEDYFARFPGRSAELQRLLKPSSAAAVYSPPKSSPREILLEPGQSVDDFQLLTLLGKGAFASVFLAQQISMKRFVALKISADTGAEPQTLAQLDHPNIVRVYDQHRLEGRGLRLLYMQYVPGGTLDAVIERVRQLPPDKRTGQVLFDELCDSLQRSGQSPPAEPLRRQLFSSSWAEVVRQLGTQLARALDYAHRQGVLHRDIKPANVLLAADGAPKLADFNVSFSSHDACASAEESFGGTLAYMSPEQLEACDPAHDRKPQEIGGPSDIYSLGVVLWELLFGELPFPPEPTADASSIAFGHLAQRRRAGLRQQPPASCDELTARVRRVLLKCLSPDEEERYGSGNRLGRDLLLCLQPRTLRLLEPPETGWRKFTARWPLLSILLVALVPHALAGAFNFSYNRDAIIKHLADSQQAFWNVQLAINSIAFPLGLLILGYLAWPVVRQIKSSPVTSPTELAGIRQRALALGHITALIGVVEWLIAGIAYPVSLHVHAGGLTAADYLHFAASLTLCGLIAAAYPFFFVTSLATRVCYPLLYRQSNPDIDDGDALQRLNRQAAAYLLMAGGVPALATFALLLTGIFSESQQTFALLVLSILGAAGFALAFQMCRIVQRDVRALDILGPSSESLGHAPEQMDVL